MIARSAERLPVTLTAKKIPTSISQEQATQFEDLFQEHWSRVCRVIYRLVGDWDEAEDLAIDTFWRWYKNPPARQINPGGWLYRVATNLGLNALRAHKRRQHYEIQAGIQQLEHSSADTAAMAVQSLERQRVRTALARMKPRSAQLLILRHSGQTYAEIASAIGVAPSSVGTLLARAEQEFETIFTGQEGD
jgi:RNA polymerase sigma-70 factor (ECF subfamily)